MSFEQVKARHRLAWGLDVASYQKHTTIELVPVAEKLVEIADPAWDSSLIDIGCGPGTATFPAAKRVGPGGRVELPFRVRSSYNRGRGQRDFRRYFAAD